MSPVDSHSSQQATDAATPPNLPLHLTLHTHRRSPKPFCFVYNLMVPGPPTMCCVFVFGADSHPDSLGPPPVSVNASCCCPQCGPHTCAHNTGVHETCAELYCLGCTALHAGRPRGL
jgi:hypothetical protein